MKKRDHNSVVCDKNSFSVKNHKLKHIRMELMRTQRDLDQRNSDLEQSRKKCFEMESTLEHDSIELMRFHGLRSTNAISDKPLDPRCRSLMEAFMSSSGAWRLESGLDPTCQGSDELFRIDKWTTPEEIEEEKAHILQLLEEDSKSWTVSREQFSLSPTSTPTPLLTQLPLAISSQVAHTKTLLEQFCRLVLEHAHAPVVAVDGGCSIGGGCPGVGDDRKSADFAQVLQKSALFAKYTFLFDHCVSLSREHVELRARLANAEREQLRCRAQLDKLRLEQEPKRQDSMGDCRAAGAVDQLSSVVTDHAESGTLYSSRCLIAPSSSSVGPDLGPGNGQLDVLLRQLADCEADRHRLQEQLVHRPLVFVSSGEGGDGDGDRTGRLSGQLKALREDLVNSTRAAAQEIKLLRNEVSELQTTMSIVRRETSKQIEEIVWRCKLEKDAVEEERDDFKRNLDSACAALQEHASEQHQLTQAIQLAEVLHLESQDLQAREAQARDHLAALRLGLCGPDASTSAPASVEALQVARQLQEEAAGYLDELDHLQRHATALAEQNIQLIKQLEETRRFERDALQENKKLLDQISQLEKVEAEALRREAELQECRSQLDRVNQNMWELESILQVELDTERDRCNYLQVEVREQRLQLVELEQQLAERAAEAEAERLEQTKRLDELRSSYERERKLRLGAERSLAFELVPTHSPSQALHGSDVELLNTLRDAMRCCACKDRFKEVVIKKCAHMFCAECTDGWLKTRHRTCLICKQKFESSDVMKICF